MLEERYERDKTSELPGLVEKSELKSKAIHSGQGWKLLRKNLKENKLKTQSNCIVIDEVKNKENSLSIPQNFGVR